MKLSKNILVHSAIAVTCTAIGVCVWMYVNNLIFPAKPAAFEIKDQHIAGSDILMPEEML